MSNKTASWAYAEENSRQSEVALRAREISEELGLEPVSVATGALLRTLAASAKTIAEIGTGAGVSGLFLLEAGTNSKLTSIDTDTEAQSHAREFFAAANLASSRYRVINGRSADLLPRLAGNTYDLVFVDGDPLEAEGDVAEAIRMLRPGGILALARALYADRVADPARRDERTVALRNLGITLLESEEVTASIVPIGDGLIIAVKN
ncbi:putative O-methyltransferase YrrM [Arcanobacterium wilhelmae]|uniref:O-methyltransferase YrrM n=1 Tax=Arcanobacterium wilhelmae TaxID=1803177 RepID=A0ABT9NCR1_9ACTO|nr:class I SAM-dependent methyltransferase [Arcanobacterium wilhelmae]MDP9801478.1 putative O-methyltransferase YrrM [Arcanobacterium wilhelmae]